MSITRSDVARLDMQPLNKLKSRQLRHINLLGVGGVGSNFVRSLQRLRDKFTFSVYDMDTVELHNLNRTSMFSMRYIGETKVRAITHSFQTLRDIDSIPGMHSGQLVAASNEEVTARTALGGGPTAIIVDARDTIDPTKMIPKSWIKMAYDGGSEISFTWLPHYVAKNVFSLNGGRASAYEVVPSFYVPAALLSLMTLRFMQFPSFLDITENRAGTFQMNLDSLIDEVAYQWTPAQ